MQIKIKGNVIYTYSVRRLSYAICFFLFCIIDQRSKTCSGLDGWLETFRDLTGVVMAVVIMSHYRLEEFKKWKIPYLVWTAACLIGMPFAFLWGRDNMPFVNDWVVVLLDVFLYGYILIHTFVSVALEKKYPELNRKFFAAWLIMMALMLVSRSTYIWPFCYLVMFGCFYLTDYSEKEQEDFFQGMLDGIILGFFVLQGLCFVFRPYDVVRYKGFFANSNWNAIFLVEVLAAVFAKILYATKEGANRWVKIYYWLGAGVVLSYELMTIGRAGWLTAIALIAVFLSCLKKIQVSARWWKKLAVLSLCVVLTFPLCFAATRYLPPVFHHPVWLWGEWSEERVHSWDAWDSEKYVDLNEYLDTAIGRIFYSFRNLFEHSPFLMEADASEAVEDAGLVQDETVTEDELPPNKIPVLTLEQSGDNFLVRSTIYKYYFSHLNLWGHPYEEQGFQLRVGYWIGHAHNIFLQYGTDFGVPCMILFACLIVWGVILFRRRYMEKISVEAAACGMYLLIPAVFGMFEYAWGVGSLSILMLFTAWRKAVCNEE